LVTGYNRTPDALVYLMKQYGDPVVMAIVEYKSAGLLRASIIHDIDSGYFITNAVQDIHNVLPYPIARYDSGHSFI
jgi:hypothetical protein